MAGSALHKPEAVIAALTLATVIAGLEVVKPSETLAVPEVAERLKMSEGTIYDMCSRGNLPCLRISNGRGKRPSIRIPLPALHAFLEGVPIEPELPHVFKHLKNQRE